MWTGIIKEEALVAQIVVVVVAVHAAVAAAVVDAVAVVEIKHMGRLMKDCSSKQ